MIRVRLSIILASGLFLVGCRAKPPSTKGSPFGFSGQATGNVLKGRITCNGESVPRGNIILLNADKRPAGVGKINSGGTYFVNDVLEGKASTTVPSDDIDPKMLRVAAGGNRKSGPPPPAMGGSPAVSGPVRPN